MGLPPAQVKTMRVVDNSESRRRLSQFFCGHIEQNRKKRDSSRRMGIRKSKG